jgi:catechol 2,3-dioxygenase-like lactoylglutathione lyase family enzyme
MRITRISHINVNCRALARSRPFYEELLGLTPTVQTAPAPQDGTAFSLGKRIAWDAWILHDPRGFPAIGLDLLEWLEPKPVGAAATLPHQLGFSMLRLQTDHLDLLHGRCTRARVSGLSPIATGQTDSTTVARRFRCQDPDGTLIEVTDGNSLRLAHVTINTADLARARTFYGEVLGLPPAGPADPVFHNGERVGMAPAMLSSTMIADPRGPEHFGVQLVRWSRPRSLGAPPAFAHQLGLYRLAFIVDDVQAAHAHLVAHGVRPLSRPVDLDVGDGLPRLQVFLCPDPDGTMLEFIADPVP